MKLHEIYPEYGLNESISDINLDQAYELFKKTYEHSTGTSWSKEKFMRRASNWSFYGNESGYVAVRIQQSGYYKLVGAAGNPRGILAGLKELLDQNLPVWGMISGEMVPMAKKVGFIIPPAFAIKTILKFIPSHAFGGSMKVNDDGSVTIDYDDVGSATKYFIGTKPYFKAMIFQLKDRAVDLPSKLALKAISSSVN